MQSEIKPHSVASCVNATCGSRSTDHDNGMRRQAVEKRSKAVSDGGARGRGSGERRGDVARVTRPRESRSSLSDALTSGTETWSSAGGRDMARTGGGRVRG